MVRYVLRDLFRLDWETPYPGLNGGSLLRVVRHLLFGIIESVGMARSGFVRDLKDTGRCLAEKISSH